MMRFATALGLCCALVTIAACSTGATPGRDLGRADMSSDLSVADGPVSCTADIQCSDRIACTIDHCTGGVCTHDGCTDCCDDGLSCVPGFGCRVAPAPCTLDSECDDGIRCTLDRCRDATACEHLAQSDLCPSDQICLGAAGCIPTPPDTCVTAADCERGAMCVGEWSCQPEFGCQFVSLRDCSDTEPCTADSCDEARGGCVHDAPDADGDDHADITCIGGDDCDDTDAAIYPGASELCNAFDDNCNAMTDEGCCSAGTCTATCGTTGTRGCNPDGSPGACVPPAETCNGADDNCDGTADDGFACIAGSVSSCMTSCGSVGTTTCSAACAAGPCVAPAEMCNGVDDDCDGTIDDGFACRVGSSTSCTTACGSTGTRACLPGCTLDSCAPPAETCNGVDDNCNATCDEGFACCAGSSRACTLLGFYAGTALCRGDCTGFNTATCSNCGNSIRDAGEACDGPALGGQTCASIGMGFGSGTLACAAGCVLNTAGCSRCGNGTREPALGEQCDGTDLGGQTCNGLMSRFQGGTVTCDSACRYSTALCFDPNGTYLVSPGINYYCAFGAVSISFGNATLSVAGGAATLTGGGLNCTPSGTFTAATRSFDVTCTLLGGCDETYRVRGTFSTNDQWTGSLTATFTGTGCAGCTTRTLPITASR